MTLDYKLLDKAIRRAYFKKRWENVSPFCDGKRHPIAFGYRRYRRGKGRCGFCGAKIGKVEMQLRNSLSWMFEPSPLLQKLLEKKQIVIPGELLFERRWKK